MRTLQSARSLLFAATLTCTAVAPGYALAADAAPQAGNPLSQMLESAGVSVNGYVAASYYHSNGYPASIHQFDTEHDSFQLDQAGLTVAYQPKDGFGALLDVIAGEDARVLDLAESTAATGAPSSHGPNSANLFDVKQAYLQYATGPLTVIAGKYVTLAGAEVITPTLNTNFSRSLLFFDAQPLTHTGLRATYTLSEQVSLIGGVNNGWNVTSTSYGSKTGELGIAFTPVKAFALTAQAYFGKNPAYDAEKILIDLVATYNATDALSFVVNFDWDQQDDAFGRNSASATWSGTAAYINYSLPHNWRVSVRGEYLRDRNGFLTGSTQTLKEGTVTFGYALVKSFELRVEGRYDRAQAAILQRTSAPGFADSLSEFAIQGVYKF